MARNVETPADVDITSLRKEHVNVGNLLAPGPGTPWEDRGAIGAVPAFFKTVVMAMTRPGQLLGAIRRPETDSDAGVFAIVCSCFWGLAWLIDDVLAFRKTKDQWELTVEGEVWLIHLALGIGGAWVIWRLISRLFYKLASAGEMRAPFPPVLASNVYAYCMAPSILVFIPYRIGPLVALAWIFCLCVYAAGSRLAIKKKGAVICNAVAFAGLVGGGYALYWFAVKILGWLDLLARHQ